MIIGRKQFDGFTHRLAFAVKFVEAFLKTPVRRPLMVSVPDHRWHAVRSPTDETYRFLRTHEGIPSDHVELAVKDPDRMYVSHEQMEVRLPLALPPEPDRSDYLISFPLWPTRRFTAPPGETVLVGRVQRATDDEPVEGVRIAIFERGGSSSGMPIAYSNAQGDFVYRLPWVKSEMNNSTIDPVPELEIEAHTGSGASLSVTPSTLTLEAGRQHFVRLRVS